MFRLTAVLLLMMLVFLQACDSVSPDGDEDFSIELTLTDSSGAALNGYAVSIFPKNHYFTGMSMGRPETTFQFDQIMSYRVDVKITDYFDNAVRELTNSVLTAGIHRFVWNGRNDQGNVVRDGIYKIKVQYFDESKTPVFSDFCLAYKLDEVYLGASPYITDSYGKVTTNNILPFPILYCQEDIRTMDENGNALGTLDFATTSDSMIVVITSPTEESKYLFFRIGKGSNKLKINWDTLSEYEPNQSPFSRTGYAPISATKGTKDPDWITLSSFFVIETSNHTASLQWTSESETNMSGYYLWRTDSSSNFSDGSIVSPLISATNTSQQMNYAFTDTAVQSDHTYYYWLQAVNMNLTDYVFGPVSVTISPIEPPLPSVNALHQNYPNPFN